MQFQCSGVRCKTKFISLDNYKGSNLLSGRQVKAVDPRLVTESKECYMYTIIVSMEHKGGGGRGKERRERRAKGEAVIFRKKCSY